VAYRVTTVHTVIADDSSLSQVDYDRDATVSQIKDLQVFHVTKRVGPSDAEVLVPIAPVTQGYFVDIRSDYPVMIRLNGVSATQLTLSSNNTSPVTSNSPLPDACVFVATAKITSIYVQPISGATATANVRIAVSGDPASAYV
jgi:hypothetical protein